MWRGGCLQHSEWGRFLFWGVGGGGRSGLVGRCGGGAAYNRLMASVSSCGGWEPMDVCGTTHARKASSCHHQGLAVDVMAIRKNGRTYRAHTPEYHAWERCMEKH